MRPLLYGELVSWYRLLDPTVDHLEEAESYRAALAPATSSSQPTLLELGAGAGNNAFYLKQTFRCTLTDLSEAMLGLSRELNPECEHFQGDMRTLRLERTFDAVLVHDAVMYMTTEEELAAVARTAFAHTRAGGLTVFAPDCVAESFHESSTVYSGDDGRRALRCLEWEWDPDPTDHAYMVEYGLLLREGSNVRMVHDRHLEGLFPRATWQKVLASVGYEVSIAPRSLGDGQYDEIFRCCRP